MTKSIDVSGQTFGEWTVLRKSRVDNKYNTFYICKCSCGVEREVKYSNLCSGGSSNCGHLNRKYPDIEEGMIFSEWVVLEKDSSENTNAAEWLCRCSCGIERYVYGQSLLRGLSTNCGHLHNDGILPGNIFGRLTVSSFYGKDEKGNAIWNCVCECGKVKKIKGQYLKSGNVNSCGCLRNEESSKRASERVKKNNNHFVRNYRWYFLNPEGKKIYCKSSYEVFLWNYFNYVLNMKVLYEPKTFKIENSSRYTPDFYIPKENLWIETKGTWNIDRKQKKKIKILLKKEKINLRVMFWKDIQMFCKLKYKTLKSYFDVASKRGISIEDFLGKRLYLEN